MVSQNLRKSRLINLRLGALGIKALDLVDVSPFNLQLEHFYGALATEAMFAVELDRHFVFGCHGLGVRDNHICVANWTVRNIFLLHTGLHLFKNFLCCRSNLKLDLFCGIYLSSSLSFQV